ncbi:MAG: PAS domain-containing protein [Alphaproteobacteria bacterium]|nr:PAS domain-containing protein [Alphaproteobacteria bacterium]
MTTASVTSINSEILFDFGELFFSRTDEHGIILFGNETFQRVSVYSWEELLGKPHKIVRHPGMPRAVFWLLWDSLKRGEPIAAYVCNRAKNGRFYWVYAVVTPIDGGFLSVRLRPSSANLALVREAYRALAEREEREKLAPAESAKILLEMLKGAGHESYPGFMSDALGAELAARDAVLSERRATRRDERILADLVDAAKGLLHHADVISEAYAKNEYVPLNFQVLAAQLGRDGTAIAVVSSNYSVLSDEIRHSLEGFRRAATSVLATIHRGQFLACTARLQREVCAQFEAESGSESEAKRDEVARLSQQSKDYDAKTLEGLREIAKQAERFQTVCAEMGRLAAGLEVTRIMGKVECARHTQFRDGLNELLDDLEAFQKVIAQGLKEMNAKNSHIQNRTTRLLAAAAA